MNHRALVGSAIVALGSLALHLLAWGSSIRISPDTFTHMEAARDLADGSISTMPNVAPGYPFLLIATGSRDAPTPWLLALQVVLHLLTIWMTLVLASRFDIDWRWLVGLTALLVAPPVMEPVFNALTETPARFLIVAATLLAVRWHDSRTWGALISAGVVFALAALVRPSFQLVGLVLALLACGSTWRRDRSVARCAMAAGCALLGTMVLVGGLTVHHQVRFGYAGLTPLTGWHLLTRTGALLEDVPESDAALRDSLIELRNQQMTAPGNTPTPNRMLWRHRATVEQATGLAPRDLDRRLVSVNVGLIARNPTEYSEVVLGSVPTFLGSAATQDTFAGRRPLQAAVLLVHLLLAAAFFAQLWFVSALPLVRRLGGQVRDRWRHGSLFIYALCFGIAAYTLAVSTMFDLGLPRYRAPTEPLILVMLFGGSSIAVRALWPLQRLPRQGPPRTEV